MDNNDNAGAASREYHLQLRRAASRLMHEAAEAAADLPKVYALITENAAQALNMARVGIWMLNPAGNTLTCADLYLSATPTHTVADDIPADAYPNYFSAISADQLVVANDARHDPLTRELSEHYLQPLGITSMLDAPIVLKGRTIGVLCCEHVGAPRRWRDGELAFAEQLADFVALSLESAERTKLEGLTARLASIVEMTDDPVATFDIDGTLLYINAAGRRLLGLAGDQDCSCLNARTLYSHAQWKTFREDILPRAIALGSWSGETEFTHADGETIPVWQSLIVHPADDGSVEFISTINRDLRPQKFIEHTLRMREEALQKLNNELEKRVAERTAQLEAVNQNLETFAFSVSHDLKAPLRGIEGYSRLLADGYRKQLPEEAQLFIGNIRNAAASMQQLIDDLLAYSRVGRRELSTTHFSLKKIVDQVVESLRHDPQNRAVNVTNTIADIELATDLDCLLQIVRNLIDNAFKFSRNVDHPQVDIALQQEPHKLTLCISDNGCGFDMKYHDRIFSIFQRLHRSDAYPGTGVGLAIVAKAAERLHARVHARSTPGQGAAFYLELPHEP